MTERVVKDQRKEGRKELTEKKRRGNEERRVKEGTWKQEGVGRS